MDSAFSNSCFSEIKKGIISTYFYLWNHFTFGCLAITPTSMEIAKETIPRCRSTWKCSIKFYWTTICLQEKSHANLSQIYMNTLELNILPDTRSIVNRFTSHVTLFRVLENRENRCRCKKMLWIFKLTYTSVSKLFLGNRSSADNEAISFAYLTITKSMDK